MNWWEDRLVGFDLETTSADPEEARIVTAAITVCGAGLPTETRTWLANPAVEIPAEATAVHGVTTERAWIEGEPAPVVAAAVLGTLKSYRQQGRPFVIFNARYDLTVLDREARRHGLGPMLEPLVIDPLVIDKWLDRYRKGSRKLDAMCAHYGATLDGAHEADSDALAACRVAWAIGARGQVVRRAWNTEMQAERAALVAEWERVRNDLGLLHEAQRMWACEQAVGLAEHFRSKGEDASGVRVEWPVVPMAEERAA